ncbi:hypothetical protein [Prochlorococcus sp. MIT 1303]|uniref:hypothetical protein n=1 Tax=Prochlorococcus sp. MIT 1303 TaxID=1723647 RepID=UPI0012E6F39A|nr:hypothetical protein [Prochlorococcus sp. MIT 1303]
MSITVKGVPLTTRSSCCGVLLIKPSIPRCKLIGENRTNITLEWFFNPNRAWFSVLFLFGLGI